MMTTTQEQREECNTHIKQASDTVKEIVISWPEDEVVPKYLRQGNDELPLQIRPTLDGKDDIGIGDTLEGLHDEGEGQVQSQINQNRAQHHGLSDTPELYELLNLRKQPQVGEQSQQYGYEQIHEQPRKNVEEREDSNRELQAKLTNNYNKQMDTYNSPQMHASNIPQVNSYQQPQIDSHNSPQMDSYMEPQVNTYNSPQKDFLNSPEVSSYKQPQVDSYDSPQMGSDPQPQASFDASSQVVSNKQFRQQDSHQLPQIDTYSVHQMVSYTEPQVDPYNFPQMDSFKGTQGNPYHKPQEASHRQHQIDFYNSSPVGSHKQPQEASHPFPQINSYSAPQEDSYDNLQKDFYRQSRIDSYDSSHMDSYKEPQINFYQEHPSYNQPQIHPGQPKFLDTDSHSSFQTQSFLHPQLETGKQPEEDIFSQYQSDARPLNSPLEHPVVEVQKPENIFSFQPKTKSFKLPIVESYKQSKIEPYNQEYSESFKSFSEHLTSILDGPFDAPQSRQSDSSPEELSPHSQSASMQEQTQPANVIRERQSDPLIRPTFHLTQDDTQSFEQTYPSQPHAPAAIEESTVNPEKPLHDLYKSLRDPNDMPRNQEFEAKHQQSKEQPAEPHFEQPLERTEEQFDNVTKTAYAQSHTIPQQETERSEAKPQDQTEEEEDDVQVRPQMPLDYNY
ncbi:unnamed protein product [Chrysodeixis includens]|uniref:Uncharacterized protein n=1 Tax=Chrysodeixis includens TaxID=689277 RepID=A0A9P0C005_CHRIL|nr:unnamed protein product [Chrysodeixis includens]